MNISAIFSWASPVGVGIWMAALGVFFGPEQIYLQKIVL